MKKMSNCIYSHQKIRKNVSRAAYDSLLTSNDFNLVFVALLKATFP